MGNFDNYYIDGNGNAHRDIPLGTSPADAYVRTNMKLKKEVQRIDGAMQEVSKHIDVEISRLDEEIANTADGASRQIESAVNDINESIGEVSDSIDTKIAAEVTSINSRVDNIIAHNNDTESNSELIDIRTGADREIYSSAGASVRNQINTLSEQMSYVNSNCSSLWESTGIWSGVKSVTSLRITTANYLDNSIYRIKCKAPYKMLLYAYDSGDHYVGMWNKYSISSTSGKWVGELDMKHISDTFPDYRFYLSVKIDDEENVRIEDAKNIIFYMQPLSWEGYTDNVTSDILTALNDKWEVYDCDFDSDGYMQSNGVIAGLNESYRHCQINAVKGEKFKISGSDYWNCKLFVFVGESGIITAYPETNTNGRGVHRFIEYEAVENGTLYVNYTGNTNYPVEVLKRSGFSAEKNPLNDKIILFTGDSICQAQIKNNDGTYQPNKYGWAEIIKENNPDTLIRNYGVGGSTIAARQSASNSIYERIATMYQYYKDADYIIIQGGLNDYYNRSTVSIGSISDHFNGSYNTATFAGALEQIFYDCKQKWPDKKIGYIVTFQTADVSGFDTYMDIAKAICKKWSVPYIDLFTSGNLNFRIASTASDYSYQSDGVHPNINGYKIITPAIENWLKSI